MTSGVRRRFRTYSESLFSRLLNATGVSTGSPMPGSFTVSKNRSTLYDATVNWPALGAGTGWAVLPPLTDGGVAASGAMVYVRNE